MESKKPSLRLSEKYEGDDGEGEMFPELQIQLAQELTTILDSQLLETDKMRSSESPPSSDTEDLSFKLFTTSDPTKTKGPDVSRRCPVEESSSDSDSEYERLASVAVSAQQVLSGSGLGRADTKCEHSNRDKLVKHAEEHCKQQSNSSVSVDSSDNVSVKKRCKQEGRISDVTPLNEKKTKKNRNKHKYSEISTAEICQEVLNGRTDSGEIFHVTPSDHTESVSKTDTVVKKKKHKKRKFLETEK